MRILHIGLVSHFTDKMLYQDNILAELNAKAGHDVTFISDTYEYKNGALVETNECDIRLDNGVRLIRLKYERVVNCFITNKIQKCKKLNNYLNEIEPDTILYHGVCGYELMDVSKYAKEHGITFYIDSHENFTNTGKSIISKCAYKYIHGHFVKKALPVAKKILYIGQLEKEYLQNMYYIPEEYLEFFPLGGTILPMEKQKEYRESIIKDYGYPEDSIICAHSGKMEAEKKTEDVIKGFSRVNDNRLRLLIFGSIPEYMESVLLPLIKKDHRITFLGWKTAKEQEEILGATDIYLQPGSYSATAQVALCDGCALLVKNGYRSVMENAVYYEEDANGIEKVLNEIIADRESLNEMKWRGSELASRKLDYEKLAKRYLS